MNDQFRFGVAQDITIYKEAEQALQKSEQQYRLLAEHSEDIISVHSCNSSDRIYFAFGADGVRLYTGRGNR